MTAYTGALTRSAHFAFRPPVPGINPEHEKPDPDPDPFQPAPDGAVARPGDVWQPEDLPVHTEMQVAARSHWASLQPPVPSNVHSDERDNAAAARMLANHGVVDYRPNTYVPYKHATQGRTIDYTSGRAPQSAGQTVPEDMAYLVMGRNAYDQTNAPNEVYSADAGRYRLGTHIEDAGRYEFWTKQGQDAWARAYVGLEPAFPTDKPRVENSAPYTPNSSGTATWTLPTFQVPSMFALPSETSMTDYQAASAADPVGSQFDDGGRM